MSFNGSGTFVVNTAGQPVVPNTVISATAFNALTADLANGLSTCITKDGQTTPTANIPMGNNKITGLAPGTSGTDAANLSQVQGSTAKLLQSVTGTDTITAAMVPALTAYAAGQMFYFVAAGDNTGAVTINIDSLGAKSVTRDGSTALVAGDITNGKVVVIVYDGTRFQLLNSNAFTNLYVSGNLGVGTASPGTRLEVQAAVNTDPVRISAASNTNGSYQGILFQQGIYSKAAIRGYSTGTTDAGSLTFWTSPPGDIPNLRVTLDSSGSFGIGTASPAHRLHVATAGNNYIVSQRTTANTSALLLGAESGGTSIYSWTTVAGSTGVPLNFYTGTSPSMTLDTSGNLGIGTTSPSVRLQVEGGAAANIVAIRGSAEAGSALLYTVNTNASATQWFVAHSTSDVVTGNLRSGAYRVVTNNIERMRVTSDGNIVAGASAALSTTATDGFLYVPTCAGTPTGTPTAITGMAPIVVNTTNNKLYFYSGGVWRDAGP